MHRGEDFGFKFQFIHSAPKNPRPKNTPRLPIRLEQKMALHFGVPFVFQVAIRKLCGQEASLNYSFFLPVNRSILFAIGGCVEKRLPTALIRPRPVNGCTMNMCAVEGDACMGNRLE